MNLFNPKSLNPARWFRQIAIMVALHQLGSLPYQRLDNEKTSIEIGALFNLTWISVCYSKVMTKGRSVFVVAKTSDASIDVNRRPRRCADTLGSSEFRISTKSNFYGFWQQTYFPASIDDKLLELSIFFQPVPERTFEENKMTGESLLSKSNQSLLESWLFKGFVLTTIIFISYVLCRIEVNRRAAFAKASEKIVRESHNDIGSNVAAIGVLAEVTEMTLANSSDIENARSLVKKIRALSVKVMESADEILWSIALKNNSQEEVLKRMRLLGGRLEDDGINFTFDVEGDLCRYRFDIETRNHICVIFREILANVSKHANCKNAKAKLSLKEFNELTELIVTDDGIGFDVQKKHQGNGFHIIRSRCKDLGANLSITSKVGRGTTIKVIFPR